MFWRLLWKLLRGGRGRLTVAIVALVSEPPQAIPPPPPYHDASAMR